MPERVLLLVPTTTYKVQDFIEAAPSGVDVVVASDRPQSLEEAAPGHTFAIDFNDPERGLARILEFARDRPLEAIVGVDDETVLLAAQAAAALGLPHNPPEAVRATRDKYAMRKRLAAAGLHGPSFRRVAIDADPVALAESVDYPCVVKPLHLSASRGVQRADDPRQLTLALRRIQDLLRQPDVRRRAGDTDHILIESFLSGEEFAVEGLLEQGRLRVLALFDKPDPLEGPTFEETIFITPSRQPAALQRAIEGEAARGCEALGLREGPLHAELRLDRGRPWLIEAAPRTIGGLCSRALRFGVGVSLEALILRHALRRATADLTRESVAAGVMMIPIPRAGVLHKVHGLASARRVPGVEEITVSMHRGSELEPLPEGHRYLGFIFARADSPQEVERALREAHRRLTFEIESSGD